MNDPYFIMGISAVSGFAFAWVHATMFDMNIEWPKKNFYLFWNIVRGSWVLSMIVCFGIHRGWDILHLSMMLAASLGSMEIVFRPMLYITRDIPLLYMGDDNDKTRSSYDLALIWICRGNETVAGILSYVIAGVAVAIGFVLRAII